jgi:hypothetical protein
MMIACATSGECTHALCARLGLSPGVALPTTDDHTVPLPRSTFYSVAQAECVSCAPGTYGDEKDAAACKLCPAGTYSLVGAVSVDQCSLCPALTVASSNGTSECQNCGANSPDGSFRSSPDRTDCECTDGHYMDLNFGLGVDKRCRTCPRRGATCTKDRIVGKVRCSY